MDYRMLTTVQLAHILQTTRRNIELMRKEGLPFYTFGENGRPRYDLEEVRGWMRSNAKKKVQRQSKQHEEIEDVVFR
jgi:hypothetical protein